MKTLVKMEEAMFFLFGIFLFMQLSYPWWVFPATLLLPDLGMVGYALNTEVGAVVYNFVHHRAISILGYMVGFYLGIEWVMLVSIMLFSHSSLDRIFDYGFKYKDDFKNTHLSKL